MTEPRRAGSTTHSRENRAAGRPLARIAEVAVDIRIGRNGTWYHEGTPIRRESLVKLFAGALTRAADGDFWLVTPAERARIQVEDAPFVAIDCDAEGVGRQRRLVFRTNVGDRVVAGSGHPIRVERRGATGEPAPYVLVRDGLEALIARPAYYRLVDLGVEEERDGRRVFGVWSDGCFFCLGDPAADA
ncbi:MAG: DUF1285 domain-containing protein [Alphaproteobacteria bacterium]